MLRMPSKSAKQINVFHKFYDYPFVILPPKVVGYFSVDENREYREDISSLRYVMRKPGRVHIDIRSDERPNPMPTVNREDPFFQFLMNHGEILERCKSSKLKDVGFVFGRTTLILLGMTPYSGNSTYVLCAHMLGGVIYIYHNQLFEDNHPSTSSRKFYHNMAFKNMTCDVNASHETNESERFITVLEKQFRGHHILYRSELLGLSCDEDGSTEIPADLDEESVINVLNERNTYEMTLTPIPTDRECTIHRYKAGREWIKCFLNKSTKNLCGFVDRDGFVTDIKLYNTRDLQLLGNESWKCRVMMNFIDEFLKFVKKSFANLMESEEVDVTDHLQIYFKKTKYGTIEVDEEEGRGFNYKWVPNWYVEEKSGN